MISLTAEQKTIEGIFGATNETYVIPMYQRPYSWGFDQLYELCKDLKGAYGEEESYFLGNIILAHSKSFGSDGKSAVVDGQQRVITIWTLIKLLSLYLTDINSLQAALYVTPWSGNDKLPKIESKIFENKDNEAIKAVFGYDKDKMESRYRTVNGAEGIDEKKCESKVEYALLFFYQQFVDLEDAKFDLAGFAQFLMKRVTMLPIVQTADEQADAENKALTIFETINNRGMDLEDADIFKARLYERAYKDEQREEFIGMWVDFKAECDGLKLSVDDVFRYYSQVIRGRERITTSEKKLREFFTNESFSPLKNCSYSEVLDDLNKILDVLKYVNKKRGDQDEVGVWLQIIGAYTNQYPMFAIVVYLFFNNVETEEEQSKFVTFLQSLVRYCFYMGSTTSVKFTMYSMIKEIANNGTVEAYYQNATAESFNYLGRLQGAYALLAYRLETNDWIPAKATVDKIINLRDGDSLGEEWSGKYMNDICNSIGNLVVLDIPKRYNSLAEKYEYYKTSQNEYVRNIFKSTAFTYVDWEKRNNRLKQLLVSFFTKPE